MNIKVELEETQELVERHSHQNVDLDEFVCPFCGETMSIEAIDYTDYNNIGVKMYCYNCEGRIQMECALVEL